MADGPPEFEIADLRLLPTQLISFALTAFPSPDVTKVSSLGSSCSIPLSSPELSFSCCSVFVSCLPVTDLAFLRAFEYPDFEEWLLSYITISDLLL